MARSLKYIFKGLPLTLFLSVAGLIFLLAFATASGIGGARIVPGTVKIIVALLTGELATAAILLIFVLDGIAWWITRASRAGEVLGSTVDGTFIILGAAQISDCFCVSLRATLMSGLGECRLLAG